MPASITAFLYAGALHKAGELYTASLKDRGIAIDLWNDWNGHIGFIDTAETYAISIAQWLAERDDNHPGVLEYEIIEPMGEWLIVHEAPLPSTEAVLAEFQKRYLAWIEDTDARGNVLQEGESNA